MGKFKKWLFLIFFGIVLLQGSEGQALIFLNETPGVDSENYTLNANDAATDYVDLNFGTTLSAKFRLDVILNRFVINRPADFSGNELINFRVENVSTAPACALNYRGRMYANTATSKSYICDGSDWQQIDGQPTIAQFYDETGGQNINVSSALAIVLDQETREDIGFTHDTVTTNSRIFLDAAGWYQFSYEVNFENKSLNPKNIKCRARKGSVTYLNPSTSFCYANNTTDKYGTCAGNFLMQTSVDNAYVEIICEGVGTGVDTEQATTVPEQVWVLVEKK